MPGVPTHIVDTSAVIAYLKGEEGHERFAELLMDDRNSLTIHMVNMCEIYYNYLRADGVERAEEAWAAADRILGVVDKIDVQFVKRVGRWKVDYTMSLGDAFAAACAEEFGCPLVTTDHGHFDPVQVAGGLEIVWLR